MSVWKNIGSAPNYKRILVEYESGDIALIQADDNDFTWFDPVGEAPPCIDRPVRWTEVPERDE